MPLAGVDAVDVMWYCLSGFLVVVALGLLYVLVRLGATVARLTSLIRGLETEALPVISKAGGTLDRVNAQLDKMDVVTTSAVDATAGVDRAVRTLAFVLTRPVQTIAGWAAALRHAASDLATHGDVGAAVRAGRDASARRRRHLADELSGDLPGR
jgi:hypothetical protein